MFDRYRDNCKRLGQNRRFLINFKIKFNLFPFGKYIGVQSGSANYSIDRSIDSRNSFFLDCVVPNRYYTCKSGPRGLPPMGFTWAEHARSDLQIIRTTGILLPSFPLRALPTRRILRLSLVPPRIQLFVHLHTRA